MTFKIPAPELQINFALNLAEIRQLYLQTALAQTILGIKIPDLDHQLAELVPPRSLAMLASYGLRGETMFPTPVVLEANARLVAYHRLLYGYSQKEFYTPATGAGQFKQMEERGNLTAACARDLPDLCHAMCIAGAELLTGISGPAVTAALLNDLTLLTLGAQLRGGANVRKGNAGIVIVFNVIQDIVRPAIINATQERRIAIKNAAKRTVTIEFASDPDIVIREEIRPETYRNIIAIEVKGGRDFSNIHNRIGEAEKSHQKAKGKGYEQCWTVVNVDRINMEMAARESPTTDRFYIISNLVAADTEEYKDFRARIVSLTGIRG